jgi:hypothetical protein
MLNIKIKEILIRFIIFSLISGLVIFSGTLLFLIGPKPYLYADGDWDGSRYIPTYNTTQGNVLFNPHSHTTLSGGSLTINQTLQWNIAMGYNACVISDSFDPLFSDPWASAKAARNLARDNYNDTIKVLLGMEYHTARIHINIILPPDAEGYENLFEYNKQPNDEQIQDFINTVHSIGGICIVDHLIYSYKYLQNHPTMQQLHDWNMDYFEVINSKDYDRESEIFCDENDIGIMAAAGMHDPHDVVTGWTLVNVTDFTEDLIFDELKNNRTSMVNEPWGVPYNFNHKENFAYKLLRPLIQIGDLIEDYNPSGSDLDLVGTSFLLLNLGTLFVIIEVFRWLIHKIQLKFRNRNTVHDKTIG